MRSLARADGGGAVRGLSTVGRGEDRVQTDEGITLVGAAVGGVQHDGREVFLLFQALTRTR